VALALLTLVREMCGAPSKPVSKREETGVHNPTRRNLFQGRDKKKRPFDAFSTTMPLSQGGKNRRSGRGWGRRGGGCEERHVARQLILSPTGGYVRLRLCNSCQAEKQNRGEGVVGEFK